MLRDHPFGGFILFQRNLKEPAQILALGRSLWEKNKKHPPFIAIDHEGGRVHRLPPPFTHFPPAALLGRTGSEELAYKVGHAMARELSAAGINLNFAPVLDVHSNPANPVIGDRSLSPDPREVSRLGRAMIRGLREGGVIPCSKHFPGHGDTSQDSHLELPVVQKDVTRLREVELLPFTDACRGRTDALMTAHVLYPSLDPKHPATLSRAIITDLLRDQLRYEGVVFSDDLEMNAISRTYALEEAVVTAVNAGVDVLLLCHHNEKASAAHEILLKHARQDKRMKARMEQSYRRIIKLKKRYLTTFRGVRKDQLRSALGSRLHRRLAEEIQGSL